MPTASETRLLHANAEDLWALVCDPHHLPRWWPRVERVEGVEGASFTQLLRASSGRLVRAEFDVAERDDREMRLVWSQQVAGTPFARVLAASEIELTVRPRSGMNESAATEVTITLSQTPPRWSAAGADGVTTLASLFARLGSPMIRRAAARTVKEALDGLERIAG